MQRNKGLVFGLLFFLFWAVSARAEDSGSSYALSPFKSTVLFNDSQLIVQDAKQANEILLNTPLKAESLSVELQEHYQSFFLHSTTETKPMGQVEFSFTLPPSFAGEQQIIVRYKIINPEGKFLTEVMTIKWLAAYGDVRIQKEKVDEFFQMHLREVRELYSWKGTPETLNLDDDAVKQFLNSLENYFLDNMQSWLTQTLTSREQAFGKTFAAIPQDPKRYIQITAELVVKNTANPQM